MVIKAVFFDFDGTISDAKKISLRSLSQVLDDYNYEYNKGELKDLIGMKMVRIFEILNLNALDIEKVRRKYYKYFTKMALSGGIRPCVSLKPLWKMKEESMPMAVISNAHGNFLKASIEKLGIKGLFDKVYGSEKFDTKDKMIVAFSKKTGIALNEVVYVGDRFSDIVFARKAGCFSVAIHNKCSWSTLERVMKENPDYIVRDFYGLRKIIDELNRG